MSTSEITVGTGAPPEPRAPRAPTRRRRRLGATLPIALLAVATGLWAYSLMQIDTGAIGDFGLLNAFPVAMFAGLALLITAMVVALHQRAPDRILAAHVALLIMMLHATPALRYETLRYGWSWKHLGVARELATQHWIDGRGRDLAIYHNWPGFFSAATAWLESAGGLRSWPGIAQWAPPVFQVLYALAAYAVLRAFTDDRRLVWLGVWFFVLANWIGQDYFAPQSVAFFLFLATCALVLHLESRHPAMPRRLQRRFGTEPPPVARADLVARTGASTLAERRAATIVIVLISAAITVTHPLSPFVLLAALILLTLTGVLANRRIVLYVAAIQLAWLLTGARSFYSERGQSLISGLGALRANFDASLEDSVNAGFAQRAVSTAGRAEVVLLVLLAAFGLLRRVRHGCWDVAAAVLVVAPLVILAGSSYGGEATFRVYLFALPFLAFFAAAACVPSSRAWRPMTAVAVALLSVAMLTGTLFAYYGKEEWTHFTTGEVRASEAVFDDAPAGSLVIEGTDNYPARFDRMNELVFLNLAGEPRASRDQVSADPGTVLGSWLNDRRYPDAYLILTRSQRAEAEALGIFPPGTLERVEQQLTTSPDAEVLYRDNDAVVFRRRAPEGP